MNSHTLRAPGFPLLLFSLARRLLSSCRRPRNAWGCACMPTGVERQVETCIFLRLSSYDAQLYICVVKVTIRLMLCLFSSVLLICFLSATDIETVGGCGCEAFDWKFVCCPYHREIRAPPPPAVASAPPPSLIFPYSDASEPARDASPFDSSLRFFHVVFSHARRSAVV